MRFSELIGAKIATDTSAVLMPRNIIPISIYVNFEKFRGHTVGVSVDGIEEGDVNAMSCRWSTSSDC